MKMISIIMKNDAQLHENDSKNMKTIQEIEKDPTNHEHDQHNFENDEEKT